MMCAKGFRDPRSVPSDSRPKLIATSTSTNTNTKGVKRVPQVMNDVMQECGCKRAVAPLPTHCHNDSYMWLCDGLRRANDQSRDV